MPFNGVLYERAVERVLVQLLGQFQETGEPLEGATIIPGVRGVPLLFNTYDANDAGGEGTEFADARNRASHVMILASGYEEADGEEFCEVKLVVVTHMRDGSPSSQETKHEQWCAAVRGIMGQSALKLVLPLCNQIAEELQMHGWGAAGSSQDEFVGGRWIHTQTYRVRASMAGGVV